MSDPLSDEAFREWQENQNVTAPTTSRSAWQEAARRGRQIIDCLRGLIESRDASLVRAGEACQRYQEELAAVRANRWAKLEAENDALLNRNEELTIYRWAGFSEEEMKEILWDAGLLPIKHGWWVKEIAAELERRK